MTDFRQHSIPLEILDDLGSRFIINVPEEERKDLIRICFQLELAHWFYLDEYVTSESNKASGQLRSCTIREFAAHMFRHIRFLRKHSEKVEQILDDWRDYKLSVPTYGAIILNEDLSKALLVQGYWSKSSWGFPKGKVNEQEPGHVCAVREVLEETGYDIGPIIDPNDYLETVVNDQTICLYIIPGVPTETAFAPKTKCEIRDVQWFPVDALPLSKKEEMPENYLNIGTNNLYMVMPFTKGLKKWIKRRRWRPRQNSTHENVTTPKSNYDVKAQTPKLTYDAKATTSKPSFDAKATTSKPSFDAKTTTSKPSHDVKQRSRKSSASSSVTKQETKPNKSAIHSDYPSAIPADFCPKSWSNYRIQKSDLFAAMSTTPGWV